MSVLPDQMVCFHHVRNFQRAFRRRHCQRDHTPSLGEYSRGVLEVVWVLPMGHADGSTLPAHTSTRHVALATPTWHAVCDFPLHARWPAAQLPGLGAVRWDSKGTHVAPRHHRPCCPPVLCPGWALSSGEHGLRLHSLGASSSVKPDCRRVGRMRTQKGSGEGAIPGETGGVCGSGPSSHAARPPALCAPM